MKTKILLIRHGITEGNVKKWYYGRVDIPLLPEGRAALKELREAGIYPKVPENALFFTSGLRRTEETLAIIYGDRPHRKIPELNEYDYGRFDGCPFPVFQNDPAFLTWRADTTGTVRFAGGDSQESFHARVGRGIRIVMDAHLAHWAREPLAEGQEAISVVVCHGGVISQILRQLFTNIEGTKYDWVPNPGTGFCLILEDGVPAGFEPIGSAKKPRTRGYEVEI